MLILYYSLKNTLGTYDALFLKYIPLNYSQVYCNAHHSYPGNYKHRFHSQRIPYQSCQAAGEHGKNTCETGVKPDCRCRFIFPGNIADQGFRNTFGGCGIKRIQPENNYKLPGQNCKSHK